MERKKEDRSLLIMILLSMVTCGIYGIIFYWNMFNDINTVCRVKERDDSENTPNYLIYVLLCLVTCGIYGFYWTYKQGNRMQRVGEAYGLRIEENGTSLLIWKLFGSLLCGVGYFVAEYFLIRNVNRLCIAYNQEYVGDSYGPGSYQGAPGGQQPGGGSYNNNFSGNGTPGYGQSYDDRTYANTQGATVGVKPGMLVCTLGELNGAQIPIQDREIVTIGRDSSMCNLVLSDMDISRRHCTVQLMSAEECYYVTDYSSLGVMLNGYEKLEKNVTTKCPRGSRILLGNGNNEFLLQ